jgi:hypothetical protein
MADSFENETCRDPENHLERSNSVEYLFITDEGYFDESPELDESWNISDPRIELELNIHSETVRSAEKEISRELEKSLSLSKKVE